MSLSPDQHQDRAAGLAATDFPAILGLSPFASPLDVWLDKTGKGKPGAGNTRTKWGELLEPIIRDDYAQRRGVEVSQVGTVTAVIEGVTIAATPDGLVHRSRLSRPDERPCGRTLITTENGLEIKTHSVYAADYGPDGTDEVPPHVAIQCQIGMRVTGVDRWDVVAFWDGEPHDFRLTYDPPTAEAAIAFGIEWWREHVLANVAPPPDGSKATEKALGRMFPGTQRPLKAAVWLAPDMRQTQLLAQLREHRRYLAEAKRELAEVRQALELDIGDADGFEWRDGTESRRLSWRRSRDGRSVDYQAALVDYSIRVNLIASELDGDGDHKLAIGELLKLAVEGPLLARYTTVNPGSRRFTPPREWKDEPDDDNSTPE